MRIDLLCVGHRTATFEITNGFPALAPWEHSVQLDGQPALRTQHNVFTLHDLAPDTDFEMQVVSNNQQGRLNFRTRACVHQIDVREFGAVADAHTDNTAALQAAISATPPDTLLEIPAGDWLTGPLFLRSGLHIHLASGARLLGTPNVHHWPVLPATLPSGTGGQPMVLGSWEGVADTMHAGLLTAVGVNDVSITGQGCIDANATFTTWWSRPKEKFIGRRPRTLYLVDVQNVSICGFTLLNAPSWAIHALRCRDIRFLDLTIAAPESSPNTDGIDPESCTQVRIAGAKISTGDDCIAIKSGRLSSTPADMPPCQRVEISNCVLRHGHAAVALGSEMSGGIFDVDITDCLFEGTQRGLRIKTRRGRGSAAIRGIRLSNVRMHEVGTPFVVNCFYDCDADGRTQYVADRNPRPVDSRTPAVLDISIEDVTADKTRHCAAYVLGLPEQPIESITMDRYHVTMDPLAEPGFPDRAAGMQAVTRAGFYFCNVCRLSMTECSVDGAAEPGKLENVAELTGADIIATISGVAQRPPHR